MKKEDRSIALAWIITVAAIMGLPFFSQVMALDSEFEKNGELYILVTDPTTRGVFRLNNLVNEGSDENSWIPASWLYDSGEARGIKASNDRTIYTFGHDVSGWQSSGIRIDRYVRWHSRYPVRNEYYGWHAYHHAYHSGAGDGNCLPHLTGGQAAESSRRSAMIPINGTVFGRSGWYSIPNGYWYHTRDLADMNPAKSGEEAARFTYSDTVEIKNHNYNLYKWRDGVQAVGTPASISQANVAQSQEERMKRHILNGCHDGCTSRSKDEEIPAITQITDVTISMTGNTPHTYFYIRADKPGSRGKILKDGVQVNSSNEKIIGDPHDPTTRFIGASSRNSSQDYIYVLGDNEIKRWLSSVGFPTGSVRIDRISVSDMWWQTGGMIFALDSSNSVVYKFERNEESAQISAPMKISIPPGVTDITSDGFGNLYFSNTLLSPAGATPPFTPADIDFSALTWTSEPGGYSADALFLQRVEKTVWRRNYYNGMTTKVGKVKAGAITWKRRVSYAGPTPPRNKAQWEAQASRITYLSNPVKNGSYDLSHTSEISAINLASPPQVKGFKDGHIDICGPYEYDSAGNSVLATTPYRENQIYQFRVENFPWFDNYGVNTNSDMGGTDDLNGNGFTGGFVSSLVQKIPDGWPGAGGAGITYSWKIVKKTDRYGKPVPPDKQVVFGPVTTPNPIINYLYEGGDYEVQVSCNFHWYDYDKLPAGNLYSERHKVASYNTLSPSVLNGNIAGNGAAGGVSAKAPKGAGFMKNPFLSFSGDGTWAQAAMKVQRVEVLNVPGGVGIVVANPAYDPMGRYDTTKAGDVKRMKWDSRSIRESSSAAYLPKGNERNLPDIPVFVIDEDDTARWTIKENLTNLPLAQYSKDPASPAGRPNQPPPYRDRLKMMSLDDSLGSYSLPDPKFLNTPGTEQKIYCGNLLANPEFKWIVYRDPLVIPYRMVGSNKMPTIRWKDAWNETTGTRKTGVGPAVKWTWELMDDTGNPVIVGEQNSATLPELNPYTQASDGTVTLNLWDTPSAPGLYRLTVKINRIYVYETFEEVGSKWNPSTGQIDKRVEAVEHAQNLMLAAQCLVYVRDKTPPQAFSAYNGSGDLPKFYGFSGSPITTALVSSGGTRSFEVFVEDNNPFDSQVRNPQLDASSSVVWKSGSRPVEFDPSRKHAGLINHETAFLGFDGQGKPRTSKEYVALPKTLNPSAADRATIASRGQNPWLASYSSKNSAATVTRQGGTAKFRNSDGTFKALANPHTVSYMVYDVDIDRLNRFSRPTDMTLDGDDAGNSDPDDDSDVLGATLPLFYASNPNDPETDLKFFFAAVDASGNTIESGTLATMEVIDNVKPNLFLTVTSSAEVPEVQADGSYKTVRPSSTCPAGVREEYMRFGIAGTLDPDNPSDWEKDASDQPRLYSGFARLNEADWIFNPSAGGDAIAEIRSNPQFPLGVMSDAVIDAVTRNKPLTRTPLSLVMPDVIEDTRLEFDLITSDNVPWHLAGSSSPVGAADLGDPLTGGDPDLCLFITDTLCTIDSILTKSTTPIGRVEISGKDDTVAPRGLLDAGMGAATRARYNFGKPGDYYLVGYVRDRAPRTSRDGQVTVPVNRRNLRFKIEVKDTRIHFETVGN